MSYIVTDINKSRNDLENVQKLINRLSVEQQKLAISSSTLSEVEKTKLGLIMGETTAINANTIAIKAQITAEENELLQQWLSISGKKADTVATNENTAAKSANLSVTNLLRVAWAKLTDIVKTNPFIALSASAVTLSKVMYELADRVYNAEKYAKEALDESGTKVNSVRSEIESLNSKLQTTQNRFNELSTKENLSLVEQEELDRLKETNAELKREIHLKNSILPEEQKEVLADVDLAGTTAGEIQNLIDENGYLGETLSG